MNMFIALIHGLAYTMFPSHGLNRVQTFLLASLRASTAEKYLGALRHLNNSLLENGLVWQDMTESDQDAFLAEWVLDGYEQGEGRNMYGWALSAVQKVFPRVKLKTAWRVMDVWSSLIPVRQAPAAPPELIQGMVVMAVLLNKPHLGMLMLLCFVGLLRVREALSLRVADLVLQSNCVILCLGVTKRGMEQKVLLNNQSVVQFVAAFLKRFPCRHADSLVLKISYSSALRWIRKLGSMFGADDLGLTTHSFRRSGASELARQGMSLPDILLYGRWLSERAARDYIRRGEVAIYRARQLMNPQAADRIQRWASVGLRCWEWFDLFYQDKQLLVDVRKLSVEKLSAVEMILFSEPGGVGNRVGRAGRSEQRRICVVELALSVRTWVDSVRRSCYAGLQPVVTEGIGTAARTKASVMLRRSWEAGLQLEVAKSIATAARHVVFHHSGSWDPTTNRALPDVDKDALMNGTRGILETKARTNKTNKELAKERRYEIQQICSENFFQTHFIIGDDPRRVPLGDVNAFAQKVKEVHPGLNPVFDQFLLHNRGFGGMKQMLNEIKEEVKEIKESQKPPDHHDSGRRLSTRLHRRSPWLLDVDDMASNDSEEVPAKPTEPLEVNATNATAATQGLAFPFVNQSGSNGSMAKDQNFPSGCFDPGDVAGLLRDLWVSHAGSDDMEWGLNEDGANRMVKEVLPNVTRDSWPQLWEEMNPNGDLKLSGEEFLVFAEKHLKDFQWPIRGYLNAECRNHHFSLISLCKPQKISAHYQVAFDARHQMGLVATARMEVSQNRGSLDNLARVIFVCNSDAGSQSLLNLSQGTRFDRVIMEPVSGEDVMDLNKELFEKCSGNIGMYKLVESRIKRQELTEEQVEDFIRATFHRLVGAGLPPALYPVKYDRSWADLVNMKARMEETLEQALRALEEDGKKVYTEEQIHFRMGFAKRTWKDLNQQQILDASEELWLKRLEGEGAHPGVAEALASQIKGMICSPVAKR
eukprot:s313_g6.t1